MKTSGNTNIDYHQQKTFPSNSFYKSKIIIDVPSNNYELFDTFSLSMLQQNLTINENNNLEELSLY